jgi:hypothetical protein
VRDAHAKMEELEGTIETAQSVLGKAERALTVADEVHERSRLVARVAVVLAAAATVLAGLALLRRRSR